MQKPKRLFTALRFPPETIKQIGVIQELLRETDPKARFVAPLSNFHLTLYFIGMVKPEDFKLPEEALKEACERYRLETGEPFKIEFTKLGTFRSRGGSIAWLGTDDSQNIRELANYIKEAIRSKDFISIDEKPFRPHITLARQFRGELPKDIPLPSPITVDKATLVWSHRNASDILVYDNLVSFPVVSENS